MARLRTISLFIAGLPVILAPGVAENAHAQQYRFPRASLQCLLDNRAMVAAIPESVIFLDISSCPPVTGAGGREVEQRAVNKLQTKDTNLNAIIIIERNKLDCYFNAIQRRLQETQGDVDMDFSVCR
jgi:hypothetical protein